MTGFRFTLLVGVLLGLGAGLLAQTAVVAPRYTHPGQGQIFYMVMTDRFANGDIGNDAGGLGAGRAVNGFDVTDNGFYHGGDLTGLRNRLDYIAGLGATSIWITPPFRNQAVQGPANALSAAYHGYWITDFLNVDPHLGSNNDLAGLVGDAHGRGLKVYLDIVVNHTADVISYQGGSYSYVSKATSPYRTSSGLAFDDRTYAFNGLGEPNNFPPLSTTASFPYVPAVTAAAANLKNPAFLNDLTNYHNRGDSTFSGESATYGDFSGLDDVFTEKPAVVNGFIDVYRSWISGYHVDGFRIDTMRHVNTEFWQAFSPAIRAQALASGQPDFFHFGEEAEISPTNASEYSTYANVDATLDFGFQNAARAWISQSADATVMSSFFDQDDYYIGPTSNAYMLPTFLGNHDMGRFGYFLKQDNPGASSATLLSLLNFGHAFLYLSRGQPVVYYGDEQGLSGAGGDKAARQDMFASQTPSYAAETLIGTTRTGASDKFDSTHPTYRLLARLAQLRQDYPALRTGAMIARIANLSSVFAFSRIDRSEQVEYLVLCNGSRTVTQSANVATWQASGTSFTSVFSLGGTTGSFSADATGRVTVSLPPLECVVLRAVAALPARSAAPGIRIMSPASGQVTLASREVDGHVFPGRLAVLAAVDADTFAEVTFAYVRSSRPNDAVLIGTDDNAPYRVYWHPPADLAAGETVTLLATVNDLRGHTATARVDGLTFQLTGATPSYAPVPVAPSITIQPGGQDATMGASVTFGVGASGTGPLFYRWAKDGSFLTSANSFGPTLTLSPVVATDAGNYVCYVCNGAGMVASSAAALTFNRGPAITTSPASQAVSVGRTTTLSATTSGGALAWQVSSDGGQTWNSLANDSTYSGVNTSSLTITGVSAALDGLLYRLQATNANGSSLSAAALLTVTPVFFPAPVGVSVDAAGHLLVADTTAQTIQKISNAEVNAFAGGLNQTGSADGTGVAARFSQPAGLAIATDGSIYVADSANSLIRRISAGGVVSTLAGSASTRGHADGVGSAATFSHPTGLALDDSGNLYVADAGNHIIRKIISNGTVSTLAGGAGVSGSTDGVAASARFNNPTALAAASDGTLYVADTTNHTIRRLALDGTVTTLAGLPGVAGSADGAGSVALFSSPAGLALDRPGNLWVADTGNSSIRRISPQGVVSTWAGLPGISGLMDGPGTHSFFNQPQGLALDAGGNLYVADTGNSALRAISASGVVTTPVLNAGGPVISVQPANATVTAGASASFTVTAGGTGTLTYQWLKGNSAISGATSATYSIAATVTGDAGNYAVVVSSPYGSLTSATAALTVNAATTPTSSPATGGGGGGGGAPSWPFPVLLVTLLVSRRRCRSGAR